jgi:hypothetical protein
MPEVRVQKKIVFQSEALFAAFLTVPLPARIAMKKSNRRQVNFH